MDSPNLISVNETAHADLVATAAHLTVRIAGESFFTGSEAFKKAKELAECVELLKQCGLKEDCISLAGVSTETATGLLSKSSSAVYQLLVRSSTDDQLGKVLAVFASRKNAVLSAIDWQYSNLESTKLTLLREASQRARAAAAAIAEELGAELAGLHTATYGFTPPDAPPRMPETQFTGAAKRSRIVADDLEMAADSLKLLHSARVEVALQAEFLVAAPA